MAKTKAQMRATRKYEAKTYDRIVIRIKQSGDDGFTRSDIANAAQMAGESVNAFILQALRERLNQL